MYPSRNARPHEDTGHRRVRSRTRRCRTRRASAISSVVARRRRHHAQHRTRNGSRSTTCRWSVSTSRRLGFITDVPQCATSHETLAPHDCRRLRSKSAARCSKATSSRDGEISMFEGYAMNDVVVSRGATASMVELKLEHRRRLRRQLASRRPDHRRRPRARPRIRCRPGGLSCIQASTGWVLVPIAPHALSNRPIVLPDSGKISIEIVVRDAKPACQLRHAVSITQPDARATRINVRAVGQPGALFCIRSGWSYYATLRRKLHWNSKECQLTCCAGSSLRDFVIVQARSRSNIVAGLLGADRRDRCRQSRSSIDALCNWRWAAAATPAWCAKVPPGPRSAAEFDAPGQPRMAGSKKNGFEGHDSLLILRRTIDAQGKSRAWINGSVATATRNCAKRPITWSTSTASTPGKA